MSELTLKIYSHPNYASRLMIKSTEDTIVTCYKIDEPLEYNIKGDLVYPVMITSIENLKKNINL